jgi:hypothetical protein
MSECTDKYNASFEKVVTEARSLGHEYLCHSVLLSDSVTCSCGWKSASFSDGLEYALDAWKTHAEVAILQGQVVMNF